MYMLTPINWMLFLTFQKDSFKKGCQKDSSHSNEPGHSTTERTE
jgi:hypothetical protein